MGSFTPEHSIPGRRRARCKTPIASAGTPPRSSTAPTAGPIAPCPTSRPNCARSSRRNSAASIIRPWRRTIWTFGFHEWIERGLSRAGLRRLAAKVNIAGNEAFAKSVCGLIAREPVAAVWGYDTSSADVFAYAKQRGIVRILDKTIGDPRVYNAMMQEIYEEYKPFFSSPRFAVPQSVIDLQDREYTLADGIVVGSDFCRDTILDPRARPISPARSTSCPIATTTSSSSPGHRRRGRRTGRSGFSSWARLGRAKGSTCCSKPSRASRETPRH